MHLEISSLPFLKLIIQKKIFILSNTCVDFRFGEMPESSNVAGGQERSAIGKTG
jgi:hypothetical protein